MAFLLKFMPQRDLKLVHKDLFKQNLKLAYRVMEEVPWGRSIPKDVFLNNILPYVNVTEARDNWRPTLYRRFLPVVSKCKTIREAVGMINQNDLGPLHIRYDIKKRPRPDQSPLETISARYASCTGLSILLVDILRSVGIPARVVAIPKWSDTGGNHTWVEIWDNGQWHFVGAGEAGPYDEAWFNDLASKVDGSVPEQRIYAVSFKKTGLSMPMAWDKEARDVFAEDVTARYKK